MTVSNLRLLARPDEWANSLRLKVDGHPFDLSGREYIAPVMRDTSRKLVIKKAAQTAFTVSFLVRTFHWVVVKGWHHLYLLPLKTGSVPFVQGRIDPIIDSNPELKKQFASVDNRMHKQTKADIKLMIRGTNVESELQELPVDVVVFDEFDRMIPDFLSDAKHRTDGSKIKRLTYLSTPSEPGHGVDSDDMWWSSDQHVWEVPCPHCTRFQAFNFTDNVKLGDNKDDCAVECIYCHLAITDNQRAALNSEGRWTATNLDGEFRGYYINQFNSATQQLPDIMEDWYNGQDDARVLKSFYNQSLGEPYSALGDQLTIELLNQCKDDHHLGGIPNGHVYIGIDVGHDDLYVKASYLDRYGRRIMWNLWYFKDRGGKTAWEMLDEQVLSQITSFICVCDAHPDKRGAQALAMKYHGRFWMGYEKDRPDFHETAQFSKRVYGEPCKVNIDRTLAFDTTVHQYINGKVVLPWDAEHLGAEMPRKPYNGFYYQLIQQVRIEEENAKGTITARWKKNNNPDHWHHTDMFEFIATMKRPSLVVPSGVNKAMNTAGSLVAA